MGNWCHNVFIFTEQAHARTFLKEVVPCLGLAQIEFHPHTFGEGKDAAHVVWCYSQHAPIQLGTLIHRFPDLNFVHAFEETGFGHVGFKVFGSYYLRSANSSFDLPSEQVAHWCEGGDTEDDIPEYTEHSEYPNTPQADAPAWCAIYDRLDFITHSHEVIKLPVRAEHPAEVVQSVLWEEGVCWDALLEYRIPAIAKISSIQQKGNRLPCWIYISPFQSVHGQIGPFLLLRQVLSLKSPQASQLALELQNVPIYESAPLIAALNVQRTVQTL